MNKDEMRERLAEYAHAAWSNWMAYLFSKGETRQISIDGGIQTYWLMPSWAVERWQRQMNTSYADLPEAEKDSDRKEADQMIAIMFGSIEGEANMDRYCRGFNDGFEFAKQQQPLLEAVKLAYRKHHLEDPSIGWEELSDALHTVLNNAMGADGYLRWMEEIGAGVDGIGADE